MREDEGEGGGGRGGKGGGGERGGGRGGGGVWVGGGGGEGGEGQTTHLPFCSTSILGIGKESKKKSAQGREKVIRSQLPCRYTSREC